MACGVLAVHPDHPHRCRQPRQPVQKQAPSSRLSQSCLTTRATRLCRPHCSRGSQGSVNTSDQEQLSRGQQQLLLLRRARLSSLQIQEKAASQAGPGPTPSQVAQNKVIKRLSERLSAANKHIAYLENSLEAQQQQLQTAQTSTTEVAADLGKLLQLAESSAASVQYGINNKHATVEKLVRLSSRLQLLQKAVQAQGAQLDKCTLRSVPVVWFGVASEVRLMGNFDKWTRGIDLSCEELSDSVFTRFTADLRLPKGEFLVKFQVDGEWRLAPDWPTMTNEAGVTDNVLVVD